MRRSTEMRSHTFTTIAGAAVFQPKGQSEKSVRSHRNRENLDACMLKQAADVMDRLGLTQAKSFAASVRGFPPTLLREHRSPDVLQKERLTFIQGVLQAVEFIELRCPQEYSHGSACDGLSESAQF